MVETVEADGNDVINPYNAEQQIRLSVVQTSVEVTESSLARNSQYAQVVTRTSLIDLCIDLL